MKKVIAIIFLSIIIIATTVLAAYPADLENKELEQLKNGNFSELTNQQIKEAEKLIEEPANNDMVSSNEIKDNDVVDSDLYEIDEEVTIAKKVNGNIYAMGKKIKIDGAIIKGNAFVLGQKVQIKNSQIEGTLFVLGEDIEFSGVANDLYACGSNVTISENGNVWRDIRVLGSVVKINGTINRNSFIAVNELTIGENATINGTLNYISQNEAEISANSKIENINFQKQEVDKAEENVIKLNPMSYVFEILTSLFKTFVIALLIILFIGKFYKLKRTEKITNDLLKNAGIGVLVLILVPIISIILLFTGVASGMGIISLMLYFVILYASSSVTSVEIGTRFLNQIKKDENISNGKKIGVSILVAFVLYLVGLVPVLGGIIKFAFVLIGLGIIFNLLFKKV